MVCFAVSLRWRSGVAASMFFLFAPAASDQRGFNFVVHCCSGLALRSCSGAVVFVFASTVVARGQKTKMIQGNVAEPQWHRGEWRPSRRKVRASP